MSPQHNTEPPGQRSAPQRQQTSHASNRRGLGGGEILGALCRQEGLGLAPKEYSELVRTRGHEWIDAVRPRIDATAERRRRVLAYPDLAKQLGMILNLAKPERWNGFVPPQLDSDGQPNTSPIRTALVALCREAMDRERSERVASS